jgi:hypothetical protein
MLFVFNESPSSRVLTNWDPTNSAQSRRNLREVLLFKGNGLARNGQLCGHPRESERPQNIDRNCPNLPAASCGINAQHGPDVLLNHIFDSRPHSPVPDRFALEWQVLSHQFER